jgi:DNA-binding transcriptional regulator YbjK
VAIDASTRRRSTPEPERRRTELADAALVVLGERGSNGLTHRAVDEAAGLPAGSTSNHFRTRAALLEAAARRHVELDLPEPADVETVVDATQPLSREQMKLLILANLEPVLAPEARTMLVARYELALEATRNPELRAVMDGSRQRFRDLVALLLVAGGCARPEAHAAQLVTLLDGVAIDQLQRMTPTFDRAAVEELLDGFLAGC